MKAVLLLSFVAASNAFCCAPAFTTCCMAYQPPTIIGYQRIPIYAKVPRRPVPVPETYQAPPPPPPMPSYVQPQQQFPTLESAPASQSISGSADVSQSISQNYDQSGASSKNFVMEAPVAKRLRL
ncbi:unnamed protein product [Nippostrongylus brasiliensis]|uniref:CPCFC domain-containing protein n=1 Tax=Nippostrongylus brasiliensis TaxID=27835 RepID=A0A0N4YFV9_NIPBR|nr:unnamed protein product [Nippostrongylus brasiliensis]